jgi:hypothetical protein
MLAACPLAAERPVGGGLVLLLQEGTTCFFLLELDAQVLCTTHGELALLHCLVG